MKEENFYESESTTDDGRNEHHLKLINIFIILNIYYLE